MLGPRFEEALAYAARVHALQLRKGMPVPYVSHLLGVCSLVLEDGGDEDEAIAALLHDAAEDQGGAARLTDIATRFGPRVAAIVEGCSDTLATPKPPWPERKRAYLERLPQATPEVIRVTLADKLYNLGTIVRDYHRLEEDLWLRFDPEADVLWYYESLAETFATATTSRMQSELADAVSDLYSAMLVGSLVRLMEYAARCDYTAKYVIFEADAERNVYVQFAVDEGGLFCEAVHSRYLRRPEELDADRLALLAELGFETPDDEERNFWQAFLPRNRDDLLDVIKLALRTLVEVYGVHPGVRVRIKTSWQESRAGLAAAERSLGSLDVCRPSDKGESHMNAPEQVFALCDWCGTPIHYGNAQVTVVRNVEQVERTPEDPDGAITVIESDALLTLCAGCGNRLDREALQVALRA